MLHLILDSALHIEFLSLMQALEGFHRALYEGLYMDEQGYASVKKALGDAIPDKSFSPTIRTHLSRGLGTETKFHYVNG